MLDTVIQIGKQYRKAPNSHIYHEQINHSLKDVEALHKKKDKEGNIINTVFYEISVIDKGDAFFFDLDNLTIIEDEDKQKSLYYLNFKTSKKDSEKRYLLGDLVYSHFTDSKNKLNESGNYRLFGKKAKKTSFVCAEDIAKTMNNCFIHKFRDEFRKKKEEVEALLKSVPSIVIHFNFEGKQWFEIENLINSIDKIISSNLVISDEATGKFVLDKYLYKTLGGVSPGFSDSNRYKNKLFTSDEIISIMYATGIYQEPRIRINNIGIVVLPHSDKLSSEDIVNFFNKKNIGLKEESALEDNLSIDTDDLFAELIDNDLSDKVKFDVIFSSIPKSPAGVYCDLIEVPNIEKSLLRVIHDNIRTQKQKIQNQIQVEIPNLKKSLSFSIRYSYLKIIGDLTTDKKKMQFHLLKVIPQIYTDTYFQDPILLPAFIEKVEYNIRNGLQAFTFFKYDFYFLMNIQKNDNLMRITETQSYALGKNLGIMAREFATWRDDCPIKSFEKTYVGNISRRISSLDELVKLSGFINEKLIMHSINKKHVKDAYLNLVGLIDQFDNEKYNKHNCALGFFESYYSNNKI